MYLGFSLFLYDQLFILFDDANDLSKHVLQQSSSHNFCDGLQQY
jgi:hypothetical protein